MRSNASDEAVGGVADKVMGYLKAAGEATATLGHGGSGRSLGGVGHKAEEEWPQTKEWPTKPPWLRGAAAEEAQKRSMEAHSGTLEESGPQGEGMVPALRLDHEHDEKEETS